MNNIWLTIEEVADYYRTKPKTVRKWLYERKLRYYKIGGLVRINRIDLDNFPKKVSAARELFEAEKLN